MAGSALTDVNGRGLLSARPAAGRAGRAYYATDTTTTYRDNGSSWDAQTSSGITDPTTTRGDMLVRNNAGAIVRFPLGAANQVLHGSATDPSYSAVVEGDLGLTDILTADVSTTKHGFAPKLPNDATKFLDGTGAYSTPPGGGSAAHSFLGFNGIGASTLTPVANQAYMKKITVASAGLLMALELYLDQNVDSVAGLPVIGLWADSAGVPLSLIGQIGVQSNDTFYLGSTSSSWPARWIEVGTFGGHYLTAGDYWVGWMFSDVGNLRMYYDAGSDRILPTSAAWLANGDRYVQSDSTHKFSGRVSFLTL